MALLWFGLIIPVFVLFRPTFFEFFAILAFDLALVSLLITWIDPKVLPRLYPSSQYFFRGLDFAQLDQLPETKYAQLYSDLVLFPGRYVRYVLITSLLKVIPIYFFILWLLETQDSPLLIAIKICLIEAFLFTYAFVIVFFEQHGLVSRLIDRLHARYDWSPVFEKANPNLILTNFDTLQGVAVAALWLLSLCTCGVVFLNEPQLTRSELAFDFAMLSLAAVVLSGRVFFLGRELYFSGLERIFAEVQRLKLDGDLIQAPLSTVPKLAEFGQSFNELCRRLRQSEKQIRKWALIKTENSRYQALGEITGLVVHDLSSPLQVASYCAESIESISRENDQVPASALAPYVERMTASTLQVVDILKTLRSSMKNTRKGDRGCRLVDAYANVRRLLALEYRASELSQIHFEFDLKLSQVEDLALPLPDAIHILYNIYKNAVGDLLLNRTEDSMIKLSLKSYSESRITIEVVDSGSGLSVEDFESLTSLDRSEGDAAKFYDGLGLKLTRRLVERYRGELSINPDCQGPGTSFLITFPLFIDERPKSIENSEGDSRAKEL